MKDWTYVGDTEPLDTVIDGVPIRCQGRVYVRPYVIDPRALLAAACKPVGQKAWAAAHGMSAAYVSDVIQGNREPGDKVCDALGIERVVTYRTKP